MLTEQQECPNVLGQAQRKFTIVKGTIREQKSDITRKKDDREEDVSIIMVCWKKREPAPR